jgi:hypothetical protein
MVNQRLVVPSGSIPLLLTAELAAELMQLMREVRALPPLVDDNKEKRAIAGDIILLLLDQGVNP